MDRLNNKMEIVPKSDIIIAGFLVQVSARIIISCKEKDFDRTLNPKTSTCQNNEILLLLLVFISAGVSLISFCKGRNYWQAFFAFAGSLMINFSGDGLGYQTVHCFKIHSVYSPGQNSSKQYLTEELKIHEFYKAIAFPLMAMSFLGIVIHYIVWPGTSKATKVPDLQVLLLGICTHFTVWHIIGISAPSSDDKYKNLCVYRGVASWSDLSAISSLLAVLTRVKTRNSTVRKARAAYTFIASFFLNLLTGGTGRLAVVCATMSSETREYFKFNDYTTYFTYASRTYAGLAMLTNTILAFGLITNHLVGDADDPPDEPPDEADQIEEGIDAETARDALESICDLSIFN